MPEPVSWSEVNIEVGWGSLRGKRCIVGQTCRPTTPVLRLFGLHGWLDNANTFDRLVPLLSPGLEVFVLDFPGHGFSDHLPVGAYYNVMSYVIYVRAAVLELGWKSFAFFTHSFGALVAGYYTAMYPENVVSFIQFDFISPKLSTEEYVDTWRREINHTLRSEQAKKSSGVYSEEYILQRIVATRMTGPKKDVLNVDRESAAILLPRFCKPFKDGVTWIYDVKARTTFDHLHGGENWEYIVAQIKCPVLLLRAKEGLFSQLNSQNKSVLNIYKKNGQKFVYKMVDGKHHVHLTHPERVSSSVNAFLSGFTHLERKEKVKSKL